MAGRRVAAGATGTPAERLAELRAALADFPPRVATRGRHYALEGRVGDVELSPTGFSAVVEGTDLYDCGWEWLDEVGWCPDCSCPVGPECKHAYAVAYILLKEIPAWEAADAWSDLPPAPHHREAGRPAVHVPDGRQPTSGRQRARSPLDLLRSAPNPWTRRQALEMLLAFAPAPRLSYAPAVAAALEEPDPDLACWRIARALADAAGGWLPRELEDYRGRDDLAARVTAHERQRLADELAAWVRAPRSVADRHLRLVFGLAPQGDGSARVTLEVRVTSPRLRDAPRTIAQIQQLRAEVRRDPSALPAEQAALLEWLPDYGTGTPYQGWMPGRPVAADGTRLALAPSHLLALLARLTAPLDAIATWGDADGALDPDLATRGGVVAGGPVRLRSETARVLPTLITPAGDVRVALAVRWPDGDERPLDGVVMIRGGDPWSAVSRSLVLASGAFSLVGEEPPAALLARFAAAGDLPLPPARRREAIGLLAARFPHLEATIAPHRRRHAVTPAVALDLRDDDWLQVRLFAHGGGRDWRPGHPAGDAPVFECTSGAGWARLAGRTAEPDGDIEDGQSPRAGGASDPIATPNDPPPPPTDGAYDLIVTPDDPPSHATTEPPADPGSGATTRGLDVPAGRPPEASALAVATDPRPAEASAAALTDLPRPAAPPPARDPADGADVWIEEPDPGAVAPAMDWIERLGARPGATRGPGGHRPPWSDCGTGWWMQASRQRMDAFAAAWAARPPGVAWFGTEPVRRLLAGGRVTARIRIPPSGIDWLAVSAEWEAEGRTLGAADLAKLRAATTSFVRLESGWVRREIVAEHDEGTALLADLGIEPGAGEQRVGMWQLAGARQETLDALARFGADAEAMRAIEDLRTRIAAFTGLPEIAVPPGLAAELRPYQRRGLDFLAYTAELGLGAVLADDMGLGKTVQALAWLAHLRAAAPDGGPALVVCPASVVHNWASEAARFTPDLRVLVLARGRERHTLRAAAADHDLVVTNYALLRRDQDAWAKLDFRAVILDEAQNIKNPDAAVTRAALALRCRHRLALTGTPLENRALDLWSIVSFLNPGYLGSRSAFIARFDQADAPPHARTLLAAKLRPILLRRLKREVATELPPRIEEIRHCALTRGQRQLYLAELARSRRVVARAGATPETLARSKITILAALTRLRQICCHPALAGGTAGLGSGKFDALAELLEPLLAEGHKVLLFSQFVRCLRLLRADLERRGVPCHVLTGQTVKRAEVVDAFGADPRACVFLVSLRAGGTGLNLTSASYVVLFDPWWNPAVEAQAIDRTHRIGQDRTVIAYRMLAEGTIEEKIWALQQRKAALARDVLGEDGFARALTRDDLEYLLADG